MNDQLQNQKMNGSTPLILKRTLEVICGKWRLFIIFQLSEEARRYGELRKMIPEVSEKVLVQELKELVALGVLEKKSYNEMPPRVEYSLTIKGQKALPVLLELMSVGETFLKP
jgi:DNA-binding HxlR family transcriptional regulator